MTRSSSNSTESREVACPSFRYRFQNDAYRLPNHGPVPLCCVRVIPCRRQVQRSGYTSQHRIELLGRVVSRCYTKIANMLILVFCCRQSASASVSSPLMCMDSSYRTCTLKARQVKDLFNSTGSHLLWPRAVQYLSWSRDASWESLILRLSRLNSTILIRSS